MMQEQNQPSNEEENNDDDRVDSNIPSELSHGKMPGIHRERLPDSRKAITHKFSVHGTKGYLIVGLYDDGRPGELFIKIAKEGSTLSGLCDTVGILTSLGLQYGVPLQAMIEKLQHTKFEPSGNSNNPDIGKASSLIDYIFRWLEMEFPESQ